jgi:tRNA 2-selenouridine synthase
MSTWNEPELIELFSSNKPLIDVRAPVEFLEGSIPNSVNLPIMNDEERRLIGTCYKDFGQEAAIKLGHELVSGDIKEARINLWRDYIKANPSVEVFCFRGGLRSQITCQWIDRNKTPIPGGYKRLRKFFLSWIDESPMPNLLRIGGYTGSGKTKLLLKLKHHLDIEGLANHRGSSFGRNGPQPSQITFENGIAKNLMLNAGKKIVVEDESATLGRLVIPKRIFQQMRDSSLIILDIDPEERMHNIFEDYVKDASADFFLEGLGRIQKKLGGPSFKYLSEEITTAFNKGMAIDHHAGWITVLLRDYYDPLYQKDLKYNQDKVIFKGKAEEVLAFLAES